MEQAPESIGKRLRRLREDNKRTLAEVAATLHIDTAILSKIERSERKLNKELIHRLIRIYNADERELMILYLCERILFELNDQEFKLEALQMALKRVKASEST